MPTYYARGISAHLGAMPLADTITHDIVLRKGEAAKQQCETAEMRLRESKFLAEERVIFPGDEAGFELNWLGNAPFIQVQAGGDLFRPMDKRASLGRAESPIAQTSYGSRCAREFTGTRTHIPSTTAACLRQQPIRTDNLADETHNDDKPRALVLHIQLSDKTFVSGLDKIKSHLKIDVFFNGQLSSCLFFPIHDVRSGVKSFHQVFAGTRIDFLAERPWVVLPPGVTADGNVRRVDKFPSAQQRWQQICQVLQEEADERGKDKYGFRPPSAEFLTALAAMQMPDQVNEMQRPGGRQFGVIDVVISAGDGRKVTSGTSYLKAPQRLADRNFPLMASSKGFTKQSYVKCVERDDNEDDARDIVEPNPEVNDEDSGGDSTSEYEPQPKRQALTSHVLPMHSTPITPFPLPSSIPFMEMQIPSMLPPTQNTSKILTWPSARRATPKAQEGGHTVSFPSPEQGPAHHDPDADVHGRRQWHDETTDSIPQVFHSHFDSATGSARTPHMRSSPYADLTMSLRSHSSLMNLISFGSVLPTSGPLEQSPGDFKGSFQHPPLPPSTRTRTNGSLPNSSPYSASTSLHEQGRQGSLNVQLTPLSRPYPSNQIRFGLGSQPPGVLRFSGHISSMSPYMPPSFDPCGTLPSAGCSFPPLYNHCPSAPLPPKGLYTVPTKPKASTSPPKDPELIDPGNVRPSILISRVIITGKHGATLVDHRWFTAQRIAVNPEALSAKLSPDRLPVRSKEESPKSTEYAEPPIGIHQPRRGTVRICSPPLTPSMEISNPSKAPTQKLMASFLDATRPVPRSHTASEGSNFLGVQASKATTFRVEDPEEVLRKASRSRQSMSPVKRSPNSAVVPQHTYSAPVAGSMIASETVVSSPLSSAPTTPEPQVAPVQSSMPTEVATLSPTKLRASIVQANGSIERDVCPTPHRLSQMPSPSRLASTMMPHLQAQELSTPKSSPSPNTKKRKALSRGLPRQPRSPDRLKTADNPPMNRDCVIAYAETEDKNNGRGVLRQVRGERQGVFQEEYVVFATRFFVAGD